MPKLKVIPMPTQARILKAMAEVEGLRIYCWGGSDLSKGSHRISWAGVGHAREIEVREWFVTAVVVMAWYVECPDCDDDELFRIVTDQFQLGDVPAIVFDPRPRTPEIRFDVEGLNGPESC